MSVSTTEIPSHLLTPGPSIEKYLDAYVRELDIPVNLREAVAYALLGGGKRLRPLLAWHCCAGVGAKGELSLPAGAAVELIHAFSLVHDDLPAIDNDTMRRGKPTLHVHAGEAMAILAGDAKLTYAFQIIAEKVTDPAVAGTLVRELALGTSGMITGQVYDTLGGFAPGLSDEQKLVLIHSNKTGALLRASCRMGAICGLAARTGKPGRELQLITDYAEAIGLMFQIVDDILDVTQSAAHTGKATGKDVDAGKLTYPSVLGLERSRAEVVKLRDKALNACHELGPSAEPLAQLAAYMAVRTK
jgi:geranylgeranyl diphosphate synthase type II